MKKFKAKIYLISHIEGCKEDFNGSYIDGFFSCPDHQRAPYFPTAGYCKETSKGMLFIPSTSIKYIDLELVNEDDNGNNENLCEQRRMARG